MPLIIENLPMILTAAAIGQLAIALINLRLENNKPDIECTIEGLPNISSLFHSDLDEDSLPEIAAGDQNGNVYLITNPPEIAERLTVVGPERWPRSPRP